MDADREVADELMTAAEANKPANVTVGVSVGGWKLVRPIGIPVEARL
jgi:hypothetical protein